MKNRKKKVRYYKRTFYNVDMELYNYVTKGLPVKTKPKLTVYDMIYKEVDGKLYMHQNGKWIENHWYINDEFREINEKEAFLEIL